MLAPEKPRTGGVTLQKERWTMNVLFSLARAFLALVLLTVAVGFIASAPAQAYGPVGLFQVDLYQPEPVKPTADLRAWPSTMADMDRTEGLIGKKQATRRGSCLLIWRGSYSKVN